MVTICGKLKLLDNPAILVFRLYIYMYIFIGLGHGRA